MTPSRMTFEQKCVLWAAVAMVPAAYLGNRLGGVLALAPDPFTGLARAPQLLMASLAAAPIALAGGFAGLAGAALAAVVPLIVAAIVLVQRDRPMRPGEEHGSARWADPSELAPFRDESNPDPAHNSIPLTKNVALAVSRERHSIDYDRNLNLFVVGGSGSGKTRGYVKPLVAQRAGDMIITDPKGDLISDVGAALVREGYELSSFNTLLSDRSLVYNPLAYVKTDLEVQSFAEMLIHMRKKDPKVKGDPFWDEAAILLITALVAFLRDYMGPADYTIGGLMRLFSMAKVMEDREDYESPLDKAFLQIETGYISVPAEGGEPGGGRRIAAGGFRRKPSGLERNYDGKRPYDQIKSDGTRGFSPADDFALKNYKDFKQAAGKTLKSILITCNAVLRPFSGREVQAITCGRDQLHLERFGDEGPKRCLFLIFEDVDQSVLGFLHGMIVYQAVKILCKKALERYGGKLPRLVNFVLDEYRSLSLPDDISAMISVLRSRNIAMSVIVQAVSQLGELYDEKTANSIMACCDTLLFLGAAPTDKETPRFISDLCGTQTVLDVNTSTSHGGSGAGGWQRSSSKISRPLITPDEVSRLPNAQAIVQIRGAAPCKDEKLVLEECERVADVDGSSPFDFKAYKEARYGRRAGTRGRAGAGRRRASERNDK